MVRRPELASVRNKHMMTAAQLVINMVAGSRKLYAAAAEADGGVASVATDVVGFDHLEQIFFGSSAAVVALFGGGPSGLQTAFDVLSTPQLAAIVIAAIERLAGGGSGSGSGGGGGGGSGGGGGGGVSEDAVPPLVRQEVVHICAQLYAQCIAQNHAITSATELDKAGTYVACIAHSV
jgi:hypothetical protein